MRVVRYLPCFSTYPFLRFLSTNVAPREELGLFESDDLEKRLTRKEMGDLSMPGTLDAELDRVGVHLGRRGEPYMSSHNLDKTAMKFYPEAKDEGFPLSGFQTTQKQRESLAETLIAADIRHKKKTKPSIFRWEVHYVMSKGDFEHEKNRFVRMFVFMKELQRKYYLTDDAIQYLIKIVQNRYDPENGLLTLECEKYPNREDNRREIMRIVEDLVREGKKKFPTSHAHKRGSYVSRRYPRLPSSSKGCETEVQLKEFFDMVDSDSDGKISKDDWKVFFHKSGEKMEDSHIEELMLFADEDSDGHLNFSEFSNALSAACAPDIQPKKNSPGVYNLKKRSIIFEFHKKSIHANVELEDQVA